MTFRLKKQVIDILRVLYKKESEIFARDLKKERKIDYNVFISVVNYLITYDLGGFKEVDLNQISLNKGGINYLKMELHGN